MAASLVPLERSVESGHFLRELFYALTPIVISVPLLRHRPEDLEPLAQYFLEESNRGAAHQISGFHDAVLQQFRRYNWPGNVAELRTKPDKTRQKRLNCSELPDRGCIVEWNFWESSTGIRPTNFPQTTKIQMSDFWPTMNCPGSAISG